jgi:hypothetical protein
MVRSVSGQNSLYSRCLSGSRRGRHRRFSLYKAYIVGTFHPVTLTFHAHRGNPRKQLGPRPAWTWRIRDEENVVCLDGSRANGRANASAGGWRSRSDRAKPYGDARATATPRVTATPAPTLTPPPTHTPYLHAAADVRTYTPLPAFRHAQPTAAPTAEAQPPVEIGSGRRPLWRSYTLRSSEQPGDLACSAAPVVEADSQVNGNVVVTAAP